jgi:hypothetical protein
MIGRYLEKRFIFLQINTADFAAQLNGPLVFFRDGILNMPTTQLSGLQSTSTFYVHENMTENYLLCTTKQRKLLSWMKIQ